MHECGTCTYFIVYGALKPHHLEVFHSTPITPTSTAKLSSRASREASHELDPRNARIGMSNAYARNRVRSDRWNLGPTSGSRQNHEIGRYAHRAFQVRRQFPTPRVSREIATRTIQKQTNKQRVSNITTYTCAQRHSISRTRTHLREHESGRCARR